MVRSRRMVMALFVGFILISSQFAYAGLAEYIAKPDPSYAFNVVSSTTNAVDGNTIMVVELTSQTWKDNVWKHWMVVAVPKEVKFKDKAFLLIWGGDNGGPAPVLDDSPESRAVSMISAKTGSVVVMLFQVPNQPLYNGLSEDNLISYTYEQYYNSKDEEWPLLLPMAKSAVKAMDAVQAIGKEKLSQDITAFVVGGASKRGWTTWLTAASDPRVIAAVPMVIDVLNMGPQMEHQLKVYGTYSDMIKPYTERGIQRLISSPEGQALLKVVDPYSHIDKVTMPKLLVLGTNDPYWCVDSANLYFPELKGKKFIRYEPNAGHGLGFGVVPTILAFYSAALTGDPLPNLDWKHLPDGSLDVTWDVPAAKAVLWQATSPNRDFRESQWTSSPLEGEGHCVASVAAPAQGWAAYYVEVQFPAKDGGSPCGYCTQMTVVPDTYPDHAQAAAAPAAAEAPADAATK